MNTFEELMWLNNEYFEIILYWDACGDSAVVMDADRNVLGECLYDNNLTPSEQFEIAIRDAYLYSKSTMESDLG